MFGKRICILTTALIACGFATHADEPLEYNQHIRPILAKNCFTCHGLDPKARKADLRLDVRTVAVKAGAISPNKPEGSELVARIESKDTDTIMPPPDSGHKLTANEISLLRRWIEQGATYQTHWSFRPLEKIELPETGAEWSAHPIDRIVFNRLAGAGLSPSEPEGRLRLLRRLSLDLTGLPPTVQEADAFLHDESPDAYEKVVDRLLADQSYGENWARMWLDLARYADTKGYEKDRPRIIWRYRDWVIDALNKDMPYDQFTVEQLAGDLLPEATNEQLLATAFHRNTLENEEGGTDNEEFRVAAVKDRVDTTMQVWMGLTMGCAKCHSHKYDPITQEDYYSFYAFFNQTEDADRGAPTIPTPTKEQQQQIETLQAELKTLKQQAKVETEEAKTLTSKIEAVTKQLAAVRKLVPSTPIMRELASTKQRETRIHTRGNFLDQGDLVSNRVPATFGELSKDAPKNRLGVAIWLMRKENPLTSRVAVNRIWARLFGVGIVETEEDFGTQGALPSHPDLLDWLAVEFRENGWSMKKLLKTIVMSKTYQQSSATTEAQVATDPRNRLLSRGPRFRLSAETVRDQALAASGLLTHKIGGPSVMPPQPGGVWKSTYSGEDWKNATGPDRYRRALYTYKKRTSPYPAMITFDSGSGEVCQIRRVRTNTPLQALVTMNDTAFVEAAGALASRMEKSADTTRDQIANGFRMVLIRPAESVELDRLVALYDSLENELPDGDALLKSAGLTTGDARLVAVANVLLNLDETLMKP